MGLFYLNHSFLSFFTSSIVWRNRGGDLTCAGTAVAVWEPNDANLCSTANTCKKRGICPCPLYSRSSTFIGTRWDRCFVCNGTDACLGCSAGSCPEFVFIPPNQKTYTTSITYPGKKISSRASFHLFIVDHF